MWAADSCCLETAAEKDWHSVHVTTLDSQPYLNIHIENLVKVETGTAVSQGQQKSNNEWNQTLNFQFLPGTMCGNAR